MSHVVRLSPLAIEDLIDLHRWIAAEADTRIAGGYINRIETGIMSLADHAAGVNVAVLDPAALKPPPRPHSSWAFLATGGDGLLATHEMSADALRVTARDFPL